MAKKKKTGKKAARRKKATRRSSAARTLAAAALAMEDVAQSDEFYADELKISKNAETADERRITRGAAMIVWREEDLGALLRDETSEVWGWLLRRY